MSHPPFRVYAESGCHAELIGIVDAHYYESELIPPLEKIVGKHRMILTEGMMDDCPSIEIAVARVEAFPELAEILTNIAQGFNEGGKLSRKGMQKMASDALKKNGGLYR